MEGTMVAMEGLFHQGPVDRAARWLRVLPQALAAPEDGASLAVFRMAFGAVMLVSVVRFYAYGWVEQLYIRPAHHFYYWGFGFVDVLPPPWVHVHLGLLALACTGIMVGAFWRLSVALFSVCFAWLELSEKATYLNHYYLVSLLGLLFFFMPMAQVWSVDAWRRQSRVTTGVPTWCIWLLRAQLSIVYFHAGVAKLGEDWLVRGQPLGLWLGNMQDVPVLGALVSLPLVPLLMSWAGAAFDLLAGFVMLMPRVRRWYYLAIVGFHAVTGALFNIGVFPWLMMALTTIYFAPDWPRHLRFRSVADVPQVLAVASSAKPLGTWPRVALGAYLAWQCAMPWRLLAYDGNVLWNEQGIRYSWRVMLVEKTGDVRFRVVEPSTQRHWVVEPAEFLSTLQVKSMSTQPDMILEAAHIVARDFSRRGIPNVAVYADAFVSLNGRPAHRLVDPQVDLAAEQDTLWAPAWVLPLPQRTSDHAP